MRLRASTMQFGYFIGSIAGGLALAVGGYRALGATMGLGFFGAAAAIAQPPAAQRTRARRSPARAHRRLMRWAVRDSNPGPPACKAGALAS